ncbi:MAG: 16S rRNA (uracil(1498)-N(3))-methyltransferase [Archangium sp.]|nr:16S rRNA (uracil(1498)-N(3))-methyltransferase [Archangium sp.]
MIRLLVPHASGSSVTIDGERLHYVTRVLRLRSGDALEVFDGKGQRFGAKVQSLDEKSATLTLENPRGEPALREVLIVQGLPKGDKLELVLQKGTELGASAFLPAGCERSVVKLDGKEDSKRARWQRIAEEAARQSGRAEVPVVHAPAPLIKGVEVFAKSHVLLVLDEEERSVPLSQAVGALTADQPIALIIGPEGGLARSEIDQLTRLGARPVTLGRLVLRTETAALAALSVVRHLDGVLG